MKKYLSIILLFMILTFVAACSGGNESKEQASDNAEQSEYKSSSGEEAERYTEESINEVNTNQAAADKNTTTSNTVPNQTERKIIYNANLQLEVKDFNEAVNAIQTDLKNAEGFIVESRFFHGSSEELQEGMMKVRVPQEHFDSFIQTLEQGTMKVIENSISGKDVTEEFVDLESRLRSKRKVEERLLAFMEEAQKTEDLLKISDDLANVQEEIEELTGRMNYLQNKSDLATVTIHLYENRVNIPSVNKEELNTWEKTKQQFMKSINFLLSAFSGIIVFVVGNLPMLLFLAVIGYVIYKIIKRRFTSIKKE